MWKECKQSIVAKSGVLGYEALFTYFEKALFGVRYNNKLKQWHHLSSLSPTKVQLMLSTCKGVFGNTLCLGSTCS